jgi:hypothetical protein
MTSRKKKKKRKEHVHEYTNYRIKHPVMASSSVINMRFNT